MTNEGCARDSTAAARVSRAVTASPRRPHLLQGCAVYREATGSQRRTHRGITVGAGSQAVQDTIGSTPDGADLTGLRRRLRKPPTLASSFASDATRFAPRRPGGDGEDGRPPERSLTQPCRIRR